MSRKLRRMPVNLVGVAQLATTRGLIRVPFCGGLRDEHLVGRGWVHVASRNRALGTLHSDRGSTGVQHPLFVACESLEALRTYHTALRTEQASPYSV